MKIDNKYHCDFDFLEEPKRFEDLILYQLGEIFCDDNAIVESHVHKNLFELTCVISGKGIIYAGNESREVNKNDVFISLPYERHEIISDPINPIRYYYIAFSYETESEFYKILYDNNMLTLPTSMRILNSHYIVNSQIPSIISSLESYDLPYSNTHFELLVKVLTIDLCRFYQQIYTKTYKSPTISGEQNLYFKIISYIDHNLTKINSLTEIADYLNYNYVYISRIFKQQFGESMYSYFSNKKLELAKKLIDEDSMTITEISEHLNYSSIYVFSRIFKKRYGVSPNNYKHNK